MCKSHKLHLGDCRERRSKTFHAHKRSSLGGYDLKTIASVTSTRYLRNSGKVSALVKQLSYPRGKHQLLLRNAIPDPGKTSVPIPPFSEYETPSVSGNDTTLKPHAGSRNETVRTLRAALATKIARELSLRLVQTVPCKSL